VFPISKLVKEFDALRHKYPAVLGPSMRRLEDRVHELFTSGRESGLTTMKRTGNAAAHPDLESEAEDLEAWFNDFAGGATAAQPPNIADVIAGVQRHDCIRQVYTVLRAYHAMRAAVEPSFADKLTCFAASKINAARGGRRCS